MNLPFEFGTEQEERQREKGQNRMAKREDVTANAGWTYESSAQWRKKESKFTRIDILAA